MDPILILTLQCIPRIGRKTINKILSVSNSFDPSDAREIIEIIKKTKNSYGKVVVPELDDVSKAFEEANRIYSLSLENDIEILSIDDSKYPNLLRLIKDAPLLLHTKGNLEALNENCIAIIGSREPTSFGLDKAEYLGRFFAKEGFTVVSGLAKGIDTAAHNGALKEDGLTIAVLAHGLDTVYPKKNAKLVDRIIEKDGLIVSEYPIESKPYKNCFVERDRIQSGLSLGTFLVESKKSGGSMKTVGFSKKQNRILGVVNPPEEIANSPEMKGNLELITSYNGKMVLDDEVEFLREVNHIKKCLLGSASTNFAENNIFDASNQDNRKKYRNVSLDNF